MHNLDDYWAHQGVNSDQFSKKGHRALIWSFDLHLGMKLGNLIVSEDLLLITIVATVAVNAIDVQSFQNLQNDRYQFQYAEKLGITGLHLMHLQWYRLEALKIEIDKHAAFAMKLLLHREYHGHFENVKFVELKIYLNHCAQYKRITVV